MSSRAFQFSQAANLGINVFPDLSILPAVNDVVSAAIVSPGKVIWKYSGPSGAGVFLPLSGGALSGGLSFGTALASSVTDLSRHLALSSTDMGFNVTSGRLNYVVPSATTHRFVVNGVDIIQIGAATQILSGAFTVAGGVFTLGAAALASTPNLIIAAAAGQFRAIRFQSGSTNRWGLQVSNTAEGGSNAGSDLQLVRYADAGTSIDTLLTITRSTGAFRFTQGFAIWNSTVPAAKPSVTGSRAGNAALASALTALASYGLFTDSSTA